MYKNYVKRVLDFVIVLSVLLLIWPFMVLIMLLLFFFNEGAGVFYTQERPGYKGRVFKIIKFKTMTDELKKRSRWRTTSRYSTNYKVWRLVEKI